MEIPKKSFKNTSKIITTRVVLVFGLQKLDFPTFCSAFDEI